MMKKDLTTFAILIIPKSIANLGRIVVGVVKS